MRTWQGLVLMLIAGSAVAETLEVSETTNGKTVKHTMTVAQSEADGLKWTVKTTPEGTRRSAFTSKGELRSVEWTTPNEHTVLTSDGQFVTVAGTVGGKTVQGSVELRGRLWDYAAMDYDNVLQQFARKAFAGKISFVAIEPTAPKDSVEVVMAKDGEDTFGGQRLVRVKLGLTGMLAMLWSGLVWADPVSGQQVRLKANKGPGTPETLTVVAGQ